MFERIPERLEVYRNIVSQGENECTWSAAGILSHRLCDSQFECANCSFDIEMLQGNTLTAGRIQSLGIKLFTHRFYHHCHTWAQLEEQAYIRIGIDDFGQKILGPVEKIYLPAKDEKIGPKSIRVMARGQIIPLTSPVVGYVEEVNEDLITRPGLINKSPYDKGWLALVRPTRLARNLMKLFYGAAAEQWFDLEMFRLAALITTEVNYRVGKKISMTLSDGSLPDFEILNELPSSIVRRVLEQYFLYCHTNDRFKE